MEGRKRGPEEPRMKGCEGVLNERPIPPDTTRFVRVHHYGSLFNGRERGRKRVCRVYIYTYTHTYTSPMALGAPTEITEEKIGAFR